MGSNDVLVGLTCADSVLPSVKIDYIDEKLLSNAASITLCFILSDSLSNSLLVSAIPSSMPGRTLTEIRSLLKGLTIALTRCWLFYLFVCVYIYGLNNNKKKDQRYGYSAFS
jgi:hypothetical protein